ncbi:hypothetical protein ACWD4V_00890 [Streptomyces tsukubensis]
MTRYGLAIKALPGQRPPEDEDDDEQGNTGADGAPSGDAAPGTEEGVTPGGESSGADGSADDEVPPEDTGDPAEPADGSESAAPPAGPQDDARPWSGGMYDEGDETDPSAAFAAYRGSGGEEAWLDRAPDGTLTGWLRDATGQVYRYTDPDMWAIDVDDAQMTRTHSQASQGPDNTSEDHGGQDPLFPTE